MANSHRYYSEGRMIDHTPSSAVTGGQIIQIGNFSALAPEDIAADRKGAVCIAGVVAVPWVGTAADAGTPVFWDANGTPYGGSADGSAVLLGADGDWWIGMLALPTAANDAVAYVLLNVENPNIPSFANRSYVKTAVDLTYVAATHIGMVIEVTADAKTVTLPTGVAGMEAIVMNKVGATGAGLITVDFDGNETLQGALAIAATKVANNTKATAKTGDYLHVVCETAASLWRVQGIRGTWVTS